MPRLQQVCNIIEARKGPTSKMSGSSSSCSPLHVQTRQFQTSYSQAYELTRGARKKLEQSQELFQSAFGESGPVQSNTLFVCECSMHLVTCALSYICLRI